MNFMLMFWYHCDLKHKIIQKKSNRKRNQEEDIQNKRLNAGRVRGTQTESEREIQREKVKYIKYKTRKKNLKNEINGKNKIWSKKTVSNCEQITPYN